MANCTHRIWGGTTGRLCALSADHAPGHVFTASNVGADDLLHAAAAGRQLAAQ